MLYPPSVFDDDECEAESRSASSSEEDEENLSASDSKGKGKNDSEARTKDNKDAIGEGAKRKKKSRGFDDMRLSRPLRRAIAEMGFHEPTPIQLACIPVAMEGKDICACSATGTGKTAAFLIPIFERLLYRPRSPTEKVTTRVVILMPTRELALQVHDVGKQLARYCDIRMCLCTGGLDSKLQEAALRKGADIIVATPGRLLDLVKNNERVSKMRLLKRVEVMVLDEADRMLDEAFEEQMGELIRMCQKNRRQTMLFSATISDEVEGLARLALSNPERISVDDASTTGSRLIQEFIRIRKEREADRIPIVAALVKEHFQDRTLIFVRTKLDCDELNTILEALGVKVAKLHGGIPQHKRTASLSQFREGQLQVLCCTDVAARGLDIVGIETVINMHVPNEFKNYIHRVGRTARAGASGRSISLIGENERGFFRRIAKLNPDRPLTQRKIALDILFAYKERIEKLDVLTNAGNHEEEKKSKYRN